jgi:hypothetical protein
MFGKILSLFGKSRNLTNPQLIEDDKVLNDLFDFSIDWDVEQLNLDFTRESASSIERAYGSSNSDLGEFGKS